MRLITDDALAVCTIWIEARGESYAGKLAVARVIRNRVRLHYQSDGSVPGTVLKGFQFSGWNTTDPNRLQAVRINSEDPVVAECARAWEESQEADAGIGDAVLYYNPRAVRITPSWAIAGRHVASVGNHEFFLG